MMKIHSKRYLFTAVLFFVLFLSTTKIAQADSTTTPWIKGNTFTSPQTIIAAPLAVDGNVATFATINDSSGMFGAWQFSNADLSLPPDAVVTGYTIRFHTQNDFNQTNCSLVANIDNAALTDGVNISSYTYTDGDTYSTFEFTVSPTTNTSLWSSSIFNIHDFSSWKLLRGIGGCTVTSPRQFNEAYIQVAYNFTPSPSPSPTVIPTPSPSPIVSPSPSPTSDKVCKKQNSECSNNSSDRGCCDGLSCVPFNEHANNGKCQPVSTQSTLQSVTKRTQVSGSNGYCSTEQRYSIG